MDPAGGVRGAADLPGLAPRRALRQCYHALKEAIGAGQQQLRNLWANAGAFNLCLWCHTLMEPWAWRQPLELLVDRRASPWDDPARRPSHADRRRALRRLSVAAEYSQLTFRQRCSSKIRRLVHQLAAAAA